ncbi:MAG: ATP-grasp domain-containing protein [Bryobacteraceae bacterium]
MHTWTGVCVGRHRYSGRLQTFAIFDKPDPLDGPFFEETIYVTPSRQTHPVQQELVQTTIAAIESLGLRHGPIHAEMRCNHQGVWMLEVAARPIGGLCARSLRFDGDAPLEHLIIRHALGEDISLLKRELQASAVMMIPIAESGIYSASPACRKPRPWRE